MGIIEENDTLLNAGEGVVDLGIAPPDRLYLGANQGNSSLQSPLHNILPKNLSVSDFPVAAGF